MGAKTRLEAILEYVLRAMPNLVIWISRSCVKMGNNTSFYIHGIRLLLLLDFV